MGGGRGGGRLRYQVLLCLLALEEFGLGARHVDVCGVGAVVQEVVEGVEVIRLWDGGVEQEDMGGKKGFLVVLHFSINPIFPLKEQFTSNHIDIFSSCTFSNMMEQTSVWKFKQIQINKRLR